MAQYFMLERELVLGSLLERKPKDTSQKDLVLEKVSELLNSRYPLGKKSVEIGLGHTVRSVFPSLKLSIIRAQ